MLDVLPTERILSLVGRRQASLAFCAKHLYEYDDYDYKITRILPGLVPRKRQKSGT